VEPKELEAFMRLPGAVGAFRTQVGLAFAAGLLLFPAGLRPRGVELAL
jgi:hypothetical protein